ncbi:VOC family protein [Polymorphobacter sp. PAMC 29334]|uniref:VOC family protein n=1 Tax=Polymorphobacter sp. PAMC 29334 TaxID=2862331 RepID=UPI001C74F767|nr:VOC family protein [Polymorphobacter sp. PAMC 29334]QYE35031.1 VOC family protein [Polymorphobacter sp. PAMC 29334]
MFIPAGFATVAPYLVVVDAAAYIDFLVAALDGVHVGSSIRPDGVVANGQVSFGESEHAATIMVSEAQPGFPAGAAQIYLFVEDADAAMAKAVAHGATSIMEADDRPYGDRQGGIVDPWQTTWWISQRLTADAYSFE